MPLPKTTNVGTVIGFLNKEKPGMSRKQKIAIALHQTGKSKKRKAKYSETAMKAYQHMVS